MNFKVSIIVPNYNHGAFLDERLESIFNQTYENFNVIVLDDGSTDNSSTILDKFQSKNEFTLVKNQKNSNSPFSQWKKGLELCDGKYVWIAESDDSSDVNFLKTLINTLEKNPSTGIAYCKSRIIDDNGKQKGAVSVWGEDTHWNHSFINEGKEEIKLFSKCAVNLPNASAVIFKRDLVASVPPRYSTMRYAGDWYFWFHIFLKTQVAYVNKELNNFRMHDNNHTNENSNDPMSILEPIEIIQVMLNTEIIEKNEKRNLIKYTYSKYLTKIFSFKYGFRDFTKIFLEVLKINKLLPLIVIKDLLTCKLGVYQNLISKYFFKKILTHEIQSLKNKKSYAIYGTGKFTQNLLKFIDDLNLSQPSFFIDDKFGNTSFNGLPVISSQKNESKDLGLIILGSDCFFKTMSKNLKKSPYSEIRTFIPAKISLFKHLNSIF